MKGERKGKRRERGGKEEVREGRGGVQKQHIWNNNNNNNNNNNGFVQRLSGLCPSNPGRYACSV